jgi:hypothetical protein
MSSLKIDTICVGSTVLIFQDVPPAAVMLLIWYISVGILRYNYWTSKLYNCQDLGQQLCKCI